MEIKKWDIKMQQIIETLKQLGVFDLKNSSAELHFDDEGILQEITFRKKRRRREGEELQLYKQKNGRSIADYDNNGIIQHITYETKWRRPLAKKK